MNLLNVLVFICHGNSLSPPPLALLTAQQELKKYMYLFVLYYMPYSRISQDKKVFNLANKI